MLNFAFSPFFKLNFFSFLDQSIEGYESAYSADNTIACLQPKLLSLFLELSALPMSLEYTPRPYSQIL